MENDNDSEANIPTTAEILEDLALNVRYPKGLNFSSEEQVLEYQRIYASKSSEEWTELDLGTIFDASKSLMFMREAMETVEREGLIYTMGVVNIVNPALTAASKAQTMYAKFDSMLHRQIGVRSDRNVKAYRDNKQNMMMESASESIPGSLLAQPKGDN